MINSVLPALDAAMALMISGAPLPSAKNVTPYKLSRKISERLLKMLTDGVISHWG